MMPQMTAQHMVRQERRGAHVFDAHLPLRRGPCCQMRNNVPNGCFRREWDLVTNTARGFCGAAGATAGRHHWHAAEAKGGYRRKAQGRGDDASQ